MKLESLKFKSAGLFSVSLEGCPPVLLDDVSVYKLGLSEGMEIDCELFEKICTLSGQEGAKRAAARLLTAGMKTETELRQKLRQKGFEQDEIDYAVESFKTNGFIDDRQYAESYIKDALRFKKYSVRMIRQKLMLKGIDREIVAELTEGLDDSEQLYAIIESELRKNPDQKGLEKLKRRLYSKGFGLWDINRILGEFEYET